jgi:hypothetical protein
MQTPKQRSGRPNGGLTERRFVGAVNLPNIADANGGVGFFAALFFAFAKLREPHKPKREVI